MLKKIVVGVLSFLIVASIGASIFLAVGTNSLIKPKNVTVVEAPDQPKVETPAQFITKSVIPPPPAGVNLALNKPAVANNYTQVYIAKNATDGKNSTYWEGASKSYPNTLCVDLGKVCTITTIRIELSPEAIWSMRTQTLSVEGSNDDTTFSPILPSATYHFDPLTGNVCDIKMNGTVQTRYVQLTFTANSGATAGQAAEFDVYGPGN